MLAFLSKVTQGAFAYKPSAVTIIFICGCSLRKSTIKRLNAFNSQSFFWDPSLFNMDSGQTELLFFHLDELWLCKASDYNMFLYLLSRYQKFKKNNRLPLLVISFFYLAGITELIDHFCISPEHYFKKAFLKISEKVYFIA